MQVISSKTIGRLVSVTAMAAVAGFAFMASMSDASAKERWKFAWAYPSSVAGHGDVQRRIAEKVNTLSGGEFELKTYEPGALVPMMEYFDAISQGSIDVAYAAYAFWTGKEPSLALFSSYPFGPDGLEFNAWFKYGGGNELLDEVAKKHNQKVLICGTHSPEASGWFREEITSLDQLKGMKMRIFGLGGRTLEKLGVNSQVMAGGDIYPALERGVIDAAEFSMPLMDITMGFHEIAKHYYFPGWHQTYSAVHLIMNRDKWDGLDPRWQMLLQVVCDSETIEFLSHGEAGNAAALDQLRAKGVNIHRWNDEFLAAFKKSWEEVAQEFIDSDPLFKKIWESQQAFRATYAEWNRLAKP